MVKKHYATLTHRPISVQTLELWCTTRRNVQLYQCVAYKNISKIVTAIREPLCAANCQFSHPQYPISDLFVRRIFTPNPNGCCFHRMSTLSPRRAGTGSYGTTKRRESTRNAVFLGVCQLDIAKKIGVCMVNSDIWEQCLTRGKLYAR